MALKLISVTASDDNIEARVFANEAQGWFSVVLLDNDSENTIASFHGFDSIEKAERKARSLVIPAEGSPVATVRI
jgi:hypothetical protein